LGDGEFVCLVYCKKIAEVIRDDAMRLGMGPCYVWVPSVAVLRTSQYVHCGTLVGYLE
jgi:hypothetical protein